MSDVELIIKDDVIEANLDPSITVLNNDEVLLLDLDTDTISLNTFDQKLEVTIDGSSVETNIADNDIIIDIIATDSGFSQFTFVQNNFNGSQALPTNVRPTKGRTIDVGSVPKQVMVERKLLFIDLDYTVVGTIITFGDTFIADGFKFSVWL